MTRTRLLTIGAAMLALYALATPLGGCNSSSSPPAPVAGPEAAPPPPTLLPAPAGHHPFDPLGGRRPPAPQKFKGVTDTRSAEALAIAACTTPEGDWRCSQPRPHTFGAGSSSPIIPTSWTVPAWNVDPSNSLGCAADSNSGTAATCTGGCVGATCPSGIGPLKTFQELNVHRWGCLGNPMICPRLRQNTTLTFLSSHTDNTDPVALLPALENAGMLTVQCNLGAAQTVKSGTLASVVAKNRATPQLLKADLGAGAIAAGQLVQNSTRSARSWTYTNPAGTNWTLTQPLATTALPAAVNTFPAEVDTYANTDAFTVFTPTAVNLVDLEPVLTDYSGSVNNFLYVSQCTIFDPGGVAADNVYVGPHVEFFDVRNDRSLDFVRLTQDDVYQLVVDDYNDGGLFGGPVRGAFTAIVGGIDTAGNAFSPSQGTALDGDFIYANLLSTIPLGGNFGLVYIETGATLTTFAGFSLLAEIVGGYAAPALWGPGAVEADNNARFSYDPAHGGAVGIFLQKGAMILNGSTAAGGGAISVVKASGQGVTNSTGLVNETAMQAAIAPGDTWVYRWRLNVTVTAAADGFREAVTVPAGGTLLNTAILVPSGAGVSPFSGSTTTSGTSALTVTSFGGAVTSAVVDVVATVIYGGITAGTVALQFAQGTANPGDTTTINAGSSLTATKVGSSPGGIAITPTNLDAAASGTAFGGYAANLGGASFIGSEK